MAAQVCFDNIIVLLFTGLYLAVITYVIIKGSTRVTNSEKVPVYIPRDTNTNTHQEKGPIEVVTYPRQLNDPLRGPERNRVNYVDYTNVGYVTAPSGDKYILFGRRKGYRSDQYEYYIADKSNSAIKYKVTGFNQKEIYDKDTINIPELGGVSQAVIYDLPELRYNPTF
ncbi:hypothetical protein SAGO17_00116 [Mimivirus AB-566-O17]|uniref:Uncharacterized protein n=1 Tax=Mimivirus AB-566-O17 TaxID=1988039 RepID=A0A1X9VNX5_9VIRU|nr:hypothetical protein SAGO17_00116 [Mimivirus AB-566-O17]